MKTVTIDGKTYRLQPRSYDEFIGLRGHGVDTVLPAGTTLDAPDLRQIAVEAVNRARECRRVANEGVQRRVRDGTAGIGTRGGPAVPIE